MINARAYMFVYMHVVYQSVSYKETDKCDVEFENFYFSVILN